MVSSELTCLNLTRFFSKRYHLQHNIIGLVQLTMKYVLVVYLFGIGEINRFSINLVKVRDV
jgi:hypothetical protein